MSVPLSIEFIKYLPADKGEIPRIMPKGESLIGEGVTVRFQVGTDQEKYLNLKPGSGDLTAIVSHPDRTHYFIIAKGQAYCFHGKTHDIAPLSYPDINHWMSFDLLGVVVFVARRSLVGILANGDEWTQNLDDINDPNMKSLTLSGKTLMGTGVQILSPEEIEDVSFSVDLLTGELKMLHK